MSLAQDLHGNKPTEAGAGIILAFRLGSLEPAGSVASCQFSQHRTTQEKLRTLRHYRQASATTAKLPNCASGVTVRHKKPRDNSC